MKKQINLTEGLKAACQFLSNIQPLPHQIRTHQQALATLQTIREWVKGATVQINALQEEMNRTHQLLNDVGVGHPEWDLPGRVVLMSYWMKNSPANARLLAALEVVEPHFCQLANHFNQQVAQVGYPIGYDLEQANWLNYVANELATLSTWQSPPPDFDDSPLVRIRITGPVRILECPDWIKIELVGRKKN